MESFPDSIIRLIDRFSRFPGIGKKTAQRMAFHILKDSKKNAQSLADAIQDVKSSISGCSICGGITEDDPCIICSDPKRNKRLICVVEVPSDIFAFERTSGFNGVYHVLGGVLSPLDGIGPDDLNIDSLVDLVKPDDEIVLALNPSIEGDTTCLYISKLLSEKNIKISRLARGLPVGSELEYTDDATLMRAMEGRTNI
ncbi:MAG: recombination mediator RecR [Candidatus Neomarinimicrobiota bacterium]|nr:recombination mediator RecR [Candidatus Neomarinimicrobiota bacterium]